MAPLDIGVQCLIAKLILHVGGIGAFGRSGVRRDGVGVEFWDEILRGIFAP